MALTSQEAQRLAQLKSKREGRSQPDGNPRKGYTKNLAALSAEIAKLTAKDKAIDTAPAQA